MWLLILVAIIAACALELAYLSWHYQLGDRPQALRLTTTDHWSLVAWYRPAARRRFKVPVLLCHGLANNHAFMDFRGERSLARYLSSLGFDCYSVDLRGAGASQPPDEGPWDATFDDHVRFDAPALVDAICRHAGSSQVVWVGHSLGGAVGLAAASTTLLGKFAAIVTLGTPVSFQLGSAPRRLNRWARALSAWGQFDATLIRLVAPFAARFPVPAFFTDATANLKNLDGVDQRYLVANVFAPMWRGVLAQLDDWLEHDAFRSLDGLIDYRANLASLHLPTLTIGGTRDLIAPPRATQLLATALAGELALFGRAHGQVEDYGHGDLVLGLRAPQEVYPTIARFLEAHLVAEPVDTQRLGG